MANVVDADWARSAADRLNGDRQRRRREMTTLQLFLWRYRKCRSGYPTGFSVRHALKHAWWEITH